MIIRDL